LAKFLEVYSFSAALLKIENLLYHLQAHAVLEVAALLRVKDSLIEDAESKVAA